MTTTRWIAYVCAVVLIASACTSEDTAPSTTAEAPATTTTTQAPTTTEAPTTTTTTQAPTTTTMFVLESTLLVGVWVADEGAAMLEFSADGGFNLVVNSSTTCEDLGEGLVPVSVFGEYTVSGESDIALGGEMYCYPDDSERSAYPTSRGSMSYSRVSDTISSADDGLVYSRMEGDNPFVGTWVGTDVDGSSYEMVIYGSGLFDATDTSAGVCRNSGVPGASWSLNGTGTFELGNDAVFLPRGTTYCHPAEDESLVVTPRTDRGNFTYVAAIDSIVLDLDGLTLTRNP